MPQSTYTYDSRLRKTELAYFKDLIGKSIRSFLLERPSLVAPPKLKIENRGKCVIHFYEQNRGSFASLMLTSLFKETPPVVDSGGICIEMENDSKQTLHEKMDRTRNRGWESFAMVRYPESSPIVSFQFYGSKERRDLKEIEPYLEMELLNQWGFDDFPKLKVDTIEFLVIEHANLKKTIISTQEGGFWYNFLTDEPLADQLINASYLDVNACEKQIVLQHEVK